MKTQSFTETGYLLCQVATWGNENNWIDCGIEFDCTFNVVEEQNESVVKIKKEDIKIKRIYAVDNREHFLYTLKYDEILAIRNYFRTLFEMKEFSDFPEVIISEFEKITWDETKEEDTIE